MDFKQEFELFLSRRFNSSNPIGDHQSLFYSGMIDSFGIQEIASFLSDRCGKELLGTDIVEQDLDTIHLLVQWAQHE